MFKPEWIIRIICSVFIGFVIGYERHSHSKEAGVRTHTIVALASCLLMIISRDGFPDSEKFDAARIAAQVVSGVGFLGAGIIFVRHDTIQGLTTAAGIWATSALGLCFGAGMYELGLIAGLLMCLIQYVLRIMFNYNPPRNVMTVIVHLKPEGTAGDVTDGLYQLRYNHNDNRITSDGEGGWFVTTEIGTHKNPDPAKIREIFAKNPNVIEVRFK